MSEAKEKRDNSWNFKGAKYLKRRETKYISVSFYPRDMSAYDFGRMMLGKGWFNTGYHYIIHPDASIEEGIPKEQLGDSSIDGWMDSVCVLVMGEDESKRKQWCRDVLPWVQKELGLDLPVKE